MGIKRIVDTSFWTDGKVDEFTPEDKYFMLYLLTNPFSTQLGIYEVSIKQVAFQMGYSMDSVRNLIERFESKYGIIIFSQNTNEIAIKNFLRHSIIKGGKPVEDCIKREMSKVKNKSLISKVFCHISDKDDLNETVKKIIGEFQIENDIYNNDIQNDNDNDNDNDVSSSVHLTNRQRIVNESSEYENIKTEIIENKGLGDKTCDWCGCNTTILHKHHHPIPKRMGGTETVSICPNCHDEFHKLEGSMYGDRHSDITKKPPKKQKPTKHKYGEFKKVLLTDKELQKLTDEYGDVITLEAITFLDEYIAEKGYKSQSHYLAIRRWVIEAVQDRKKKPANNAAKPKNPTDDFMNQLQQMYNEE